MSAKKWGENFLKSGLPLEHIALTSLAAQGWSCEPNWEYTRISQSPDKIFFEIDIVAHAPDDRRGSLTLLTECKYHDDQRFWFFLPCSTIDHQAQYGALSAGGDLESDSSVLHYGPYVPLKYPGRHSLINLAPRSVWGVTVSRSGLREENSLRKATEQLAYAFVPFCLERVYHFCADSPEAVVPAIVTTASLFRLRTEVEGLEQIRQAHLPNDVADELPWTWCYYASPGSVLGHNHAEIDFWRERHKHLRWKGLDDRLAELWAGMHWVLVVNILALKRAAASLHESFLRLPKDFSPNRALRELVEARASTRRAMETQGKDKPIRK